MKSENAESRLVQLILPSPRVGPRPRLPMCHARVRLAAALLGTLAAACAPLQNAAQNQGHSLRASLPVAEAVLIAGQPAAARRLYLSLAERFDKAPEPALGLAYVALHADDLAAAEHYFVRAATLATDAPGHKAEALLGAGRAALARGNIQAARQHFRNGNEFGPDLPSAAWIANGLAVCATLDGDYGTAENLYVEALRRSSEHPWIAANLVRLLIAAGRIDDAARMHAERGSAYWTDDDGRTLAQLIQKARWDDLDRSVASRRSLAGAPRIGSGLALRMFPPSTVHSAGEFVYTSIPNPSRLLLRLAGETDPGEPPPAIKFPATRTPSPGTTATRGLSPPTPLTVALGQSRRFRLDGDATSVLAAAPEIADVQLLSPHLLYVIGKAVGRTSVTVLGMDGLVHEQAVSVVLDLEPVRGALAEEPDLRGVRAERLLRGIKLTGKVASAALADRAQRIAQSALPKDTPVENELLVIDSQQVNLEVQIAEVQRSVAEDLGINWEAFYTEGDNTVAFQVGRDVLSEDGGFLGAVIEGMAAPGLGFGKRIMGADGKITQITGMIDALARAGMANVLARPNVTAVSGKSASFFSGGEYPLPKGFEDGVIIFEYKKFGVLLDFVPTVIDGGRIALTVRPEVSEPSLNQSVQVVGVDIPVLNVRRAETTVEIGDGESIVIAGLFRNASNTIESGVPWLKDIPGLGALFGTTSMRSNELELIVVVTARLVRPGPPPGDAAAPAAARRVGGYHY